MILMHLFISIITEHIPSRQATTDFAGHIKLDSISPDTLYYPSDGLDDNDWYRYGK